MTKQKKATVVASAVAIVLVIIKLIVGLSTGVVVVIASAIDSLLDFGISLFNSYAITKSQQPEDESYNYGKGKIEGIASVLEGIIIGLSGLYIIYEAVDNFSNTEPITGLDYSLAVMAVSMFLTLFLVSYLNKIAKETNSLIIQADALHYKSDLYSNAGVIISLLLIWLTGIDIIDSIASILIALYIIKSAIEVISKGVQMLLDKALPHEVVDNIKSILDAHVMDKECIITGYHFLKTRESGEVKIVDVHLVFGPNVLLKDSHELADHIEERIRSLDSSSRWMVLIHQDPYDDSRIEAGISV
jgi:ferrous-iron efflux pump FieF